MANPYIYNVVTVDGAALIAQATAANPIVYVAALSKATAAESDADLSTKPASWYDGKPGDIAAVSAVGNNARIVAVWGNQGGAQAAKSLAVTARLASQSDAEAVVMTAMSDPDSTIILPGADDIQGGVEVPFNVALNASGDVEVTPGAAASVADLARFVSLHRAGDPTQGEAQTIRGEKTFDDDARFDGDVTIRGGALKADVLRAYSPGAIELGNSVVPDTDGALDLGSGEYNVRSVYAYALESHAVDGDERGRLALAGVDPSSGSTSVATIDLIAKQSDSDEYPIFSVYLYNTYSSEDCSLTFRDGVLILNGTNGSALGDSSSPVGGIYGNNVYLGCLNRLGSATSIVTDSLVPSGNAVYLGLPQLPFANINATSFHGLDFLPLDNTADLGKSDNKFRRLYAAELHGVIPSLSTQYLDEPEIGSIFFAGITVSGAVAVNAGATAKVGSPLSSGGSNVTAIGTVTWDMQTNKFTGLASFSTSAGSYKLLCGVNKSSTDTYCCALVIRVQ